MDTSAATELAATLQSAHLKTAPSVAHDANPSTAASVKIPVQLERRRSGGSGSGSLPASPTDLTARPVPRRSAHRHSGGGRGAAMPPLPDLRFEQSYLASIPPGASRTRILLLTVRDHVLAPLLQGCAWSLLLLGWRHWNRGTQLAGQSVGARLRRWWWTVNHWEIPEAAGDAKGGGGMILDEGRVEELGAGGD